MSETTTLNALDVMGLDTVRFKTPHIPRRTVDCIRSKGESYRRMSNATGEVVWEITRTNLLGSHDSRIMVKPMYEDCAQDRAGRLQWHPCPPYLVIECSIPKALHGQNIYGTIEDLGEAAERLRALLQGLLGVSLPRSRDWWVQRVDWAENFRLPFEAVQEFFQGVHHVAFPRRKMQKYGDQAVFVPGTTTTIKLYHKGPEFEKNDRKRLFHVLRSLYVRCRPPHAAEGWEHGRASRHIAALHRLANSRLRAEVEIHAEKLDYDFGHKPTVADIVANSDYLQRVFDKEMARLLREGQGATQIVRTSLAVRDRLDALYSPELAGLLHGFWHGLALHGEDDMKERCTRATFYRRRKQLVDAGVSWLGTDMHLIERQGQTLPSDFSPVRSDPRRCVGVVRERPGLNYQLGLLQLAA